MKKKIEVTIRNRKGVITFYNQQVVDNGGGKLKIQIPMKKILTAQQEKVDDKQQIH